MRPRLPPLKTLAGFDAAARLGSFAAAAEQLGLTQSAISHQIRTLEEELGQQLFRRNHRRVALTDAGRDFHRTVRQVVQTLQEGVKRLEPYRNQNAVIVYCDPALASGWLVHELGAMRADLAGVDLWLDSSGKKVSFDLDEVDIIISNDEKYGEEFEPKPCFKVPIRHRAIAAPKWLGCPALLDDPEALLGQPLLHVEGGLGWESWIRATFAGRREEELVSAIRHNLIFSDAFSAVQGAADGLGLALVPLPLAGRQVADGRLGWLGDTVLVSPHSHCLWVNPEKETEPNVAKFAAWFARKLRATEEQLARACTLQARAG